MLPCLLCCPAFYVTLHEICAEGLLLFVFRKLETGFVAFRALNMTSDAFKMLYVEMILT